MKALQVKKYGDIDSSLEFNNIPKPEIADNQVLIEVKAASVNPIDSLIFSGEAKSFLNLDLPLTLGYDAAGIVVDKGRNVSDINVGDEVFFTKVPTNVPGTFAEFVSVDSNVVVAKPSNLSFAEASGLPLVGMTVIQAMRKVGLKKGDKILIHSGSGGVGTIAIQYAKSKGAYVYTTTSTSNVEWVKKLGADRVIDYKKEGYKTIVKDLDIVFNSLGDPYSFEAFDLLKKGGRVSAIIGSLDSDTAKQLGFNFFIRFILAIKAWKINKKAAATSTSYSFTFMKPAKDDLKILKDMVENGQIKPVIDKEYNFENAIEAVRYRGKGHSKGKVIINIG